MALNDLIMAAGLLLVLIGLFAVLSDAFRQHLRWGLAVLIIPVLYPVYVGLHWRQTAPRNGFLLAVVGMLAVLVAFYGGAGRNLPFIQASAVANRLPHAGPANEPLPNQAAAAHIKLPPGEQYDPLGYADAFIEFKVKPLAPKTDRQVVVSARRAPAKAYHPVKVKALRNYLGQPVRFTLKAGQTKQGRLIEADPETLSIEHRLARGVVSFEYQLADITRVAVYAEAPPAGSKRGGQAGLGGPAPMPTDAEPLPDGVIAKPIPGTADRQTSTAAGGGIEARTAPRGEAGQVATGDTRATLSARSHE